MANEFKVRKGLIVQGSGSTVLDIQGSQGQLFSVTDSLTGSLFSVNDISGIPILEVFSDNRVLIGTFGAEAIKVSGSFANMTGSLLGTASVASTSIITTQDTTPVTYNVVFTGDTSGNQSLNVDATTLTYNPSTTTFTCPNLAGTASFVSSTSNAFIQNGNSFGATALLGTNDNQSLALETNGTTRMFISSSGNIGMGIGFTSAAYPLHVSASVSNVSIYASNDIVAFSDQSVKENIRPIENVIERIGNSRGVLYDRIDNSEKDNIGFIAQELEVAFPELVVTNPDGTKAVKYQNAVAVLFEAIKEQQKQIDSILKLLDK
jgi:hypothetical protein